MEKKKFMVSKYKSPLDMFFGERNTPDEVKTLNDMLKALADSAKEKYEDTNDKLDMLRRVEIKFNVLCEWRDNYTDWERGRLSKPMFTVAEKEKALKQPRQSER